MKDDPRFLTMSNDINYLAKRILLLEENKGTVRSLPKISAGLFIAQLHNETDITYSMVELAEKLDCGVTSMQIDIPKRLIIDKIIFKEKQK